MSAKLKLMANPAELLYETFKLWDSRIPTAVGTFDSYRSTHKDSATLDTHRRAVAYLNDIGTLLDVMESDGKRVRAYRNRYENWIRTVFHFGGDWGGNAHPIDSHDLEVLENLIDAIDPYVPKLDSAKFEDLNAYLDKVEQAIDDDDTLPGVMRKTSKAFIQNLKTCIDNYMVIGDFQLKNAIERLLGHLAFIARQSKNSSMWKNILNQFVFPYAVNQFPGIDLGEVANAITNA